jgi:hypothetical protein
VVSLTDPYGSILGFLDWSLMIYGIKFILWILKTSYDGAIHGNTGFLDFVRYPIFYAFRTLKNKTFRNMNLLPSSDEIMEPPTLLVPSERAHSSHWATYYSYTTATLQLTGTRDQDLSK